MGDAWANSPNQKQVRIDTQTPVQTKGAENWRLFTCHACNTDSWGWLMKEYFPFEKRVHYTINFPDQSGRFGYPNNTCPNCDMVVEADVSKAAHAADLKEEAAKLKKSLQDLKRRKGDVMWRVAASIADHSGRQVSPELVYELMSPLRSDEGEDEVAARARRSPLTLQRPQP